MADAIGAVSLVCHRPSIVRTSIKNESKRQNSQNVIRFPIKVDFSTKGVFSHLMMQSVTKKRMSMFPINALAMELIKEVLAYKKKDERLPKTWSYLDSDLVLILQLPNEASSSQQQIPTAFKNFSMSQKDKTLEELVRDKWLCRTDEGNIGLGIRSLLHLRSWFMNNDVPSCEVCNEAGVKADLCPNEGCTVRIHKYCLKKLLSQRDDKVCSGCRKPWPLGKIKKTEAVEEAVNEEEGNETQPTAPTSKRKRQLRSQEESTESGPSQSSLASTSGVTTRRVTRSLSQPS